MKVKTSIALTESLLRAIDRRARRKRKRFEFIECDIRDYLSRLDRDERNANDLAVVNRHADRLNAEAANGPPCQVTP